MLLDTVSQSPFGKRKGGGEKYEGLDQIFGYARNCFDL
jgi:hypothetical protein